MINEALWAAGMAMLSQSYSTRGLAVVAAVNISSTIFNVFNVLVHFSGECGSDYRRPDAGGRSDGRSQGY